MDQHQKLTRFGICVLLWTALLRLTVSIDPASAEVQRILNRITPFLIYLETGRDVRFSPSLPVVYDHFRESPPLWGPSVEQVLFTEADLERISMQYNCQLRPDLERLFRLPLNWDPAEQTPAVLILHTHTTESYTRAGEPYTEVSDYRTLDEKYNMLSIGDRVAEILESRGIRVIHDRQIHDYPSYNGSYVHARKVTEQILRKNSDIMLVLDLHRDASGSTDAQLRTEAIVDGKTAAQLMLVVGSNASGRSHPNWEQNLAFALKLHVLLEQQNPGIMRPICLREQRFNQDLNPGALIVEVGAAGNIHSEAMAAAEKLALAVAELAQGKAW